MGNHIGQPGQYRAQLSWQVSNNDMKLYCKTCYWGASETRYGHCPYGHGDMAPIAEFYDEVLEEV